MDEVEMEVAMVQKEWGEESNRTREHISSIEQYWRRDRGDGNTSSLQQLNALVQDGFSVLSSLHHKLGVLSPQLPSPDKIHSSELFLKAWKEDLLSLRMKLRSANLHAKEDKKRAVAEERRLLLGGGVESTIRRHNLQTKAGMTSAAESITETLRRTRILMAQELERSTNTLMTLDESGGVLKEAEKEYVGQGSLLMRTRKLLSMMRREDVIDRIVLIAGFFFFSCAVLYVVSKRLGVFMLQRSITDAIKSAIAAAQDNHDEL